MISFSTDELPAEQRFDHWREARGKALFGVTIELERERRLKFNGRFSAIAIGDAELAEMQASSYRVRQLHLLFEPTGTSFARTVTAMRLDEARRRLLAAPTAPITQIAFACGFDSLATFYRAFRQAFAMTPGEMRS